MSLALSRVGFGAARTVLGNPEHEKALVRAIRAGVSVVDTSSNYGDGASERLVGKVIADLDAIGGLPNGREGLTIISKVGYIQGSLLESLREEGKMQQWEGIVELAPEYAYCISPEYVSTSLTNSLERLQMSQLDVFLLHSPDALLQHKCIRLQQEQDSSSGSIFSDSSDSSEGTSDSGSMRFIPPQVLSAARQELMQEIRAAFVAMESERRDGRISWYGVSSCGLAALPSDPSHLPFAELPALAQEAYEEVFAGGSASGWDATLSGPGLKVLQFPANVLEQRGLCPGGVGQWAREQGLEVLTNRALTAFDFTTAPAPPTADAAGLTSTSTMPSTAAANTVSDAAPSILATFRLADSAVPFPADFDDTREAILGYFTAPEEFSLPSASEEERETAEACSWVRQLVEDMHGSLPRFTSYVQYEHELATGLVPLLDEKFEGIDERSAALLQAWFMKYGEAVRSTTATSTRQHVIVSAEQNEQNEQSAGTGTGNSSHVLKLGGSTKPLEHHALQWLLAHRPAQLSTVLLGMTSESHVKSMLQVLEAEGMGLQE